MMNSSSTITEIKSHRRVAQAFGLLVLLPSFLSLINVTFVQSWKIHFFPAAIFLSALSFGPIGGLIAGVTGSLYSASFLGNPYLMESAVCPGEVIALNTSDPDAFLRKIREVIDNPMAMHNRT